MFPTIYILFEITSKLKIILIIKYKNEYSMNLTLNIFIQYKFLNSLEVIDLIRSIKSVLLGLVSSKIKKV